MFLHGIHVKLLLAEHPASRKTACLAKIQFPSNLPRITRTAQKHSWGIPAMTLMPELWFPRQLKFITPRTFGRRNAIIEKTFSIGDATSRKSADDTRSTRKHSWNVLAMIHTSGLPFPGHIEIIVSPLSWRRRKHHLRNFSLLVLDILTTRFNDSRATGTALTRSTSGNPNCPKTITPSGDNPFHDKKKTCVRNSTPAINRQPCFRREDS